MEFLQMSGKFIQRSTSKEANVLPNIIFTHAFFNEMFSQTDLKPIP